MPSPVSIEDTAGWRYGPRTKLQSPSWSIIYRKVARMDQSWYSRRKLFLRLTEKKSVGLGSPRGSTKDTKLTQWQGWDQSPGQWLENPVLFLGIYFWAFHGMKQNQNEVSHLSSSENVWQSYGNTWRCGEQVGKVHAWSQPGVRETPFPRAVVFMHGLPWSMHLCMHRNMHLAAKQPVSFLPICFWACGSLILLCALEMPLRISFHFISLSCGLSAVNGKKNQLHV